MKKEKQPICKRTDTGVIALMFDEQEGKYYSTTSPNTLEFLRTSELEDYSPRFRPVAYIEVGNDDRGFPKEGKQVPLR
ncbi:hypothetical protein [Spirosoma validum]|uniref:Uncharacterized protein n=1 Tax=Spirosoma validum TaxID=2771355 RepID=A0A927B1Z4_9BACT|nr:hypothetical protein [Spirosoma validum]MBD2753762.1 hypothetical protein [Spirosoma validum]